MAYTTINKSSDFFNTNLYTGNATQRTIDVGFEPNLVWGKLRSTTGNHWLWDSIRGANYYIKSNATDANNTGGVQDLNGFVSNGFTVGTGTRMNTNNETMASWSWKASGTNISNSSGSNGATLASAGIKNDTAGISIVTYTGDGNARTVFHGLSSCDMVFHKCLNNAENWGVQHKDIGAAYQLQLDTNIAKVDKSGNGSMALPAANVFSVNNSGQWGAARNYIAYAFRSVKGYSFIGSYTGNGASDGDGTFSFCGFKPAWVMIKRTDSTANWQIWDSKRLGYNPDNNALYPNLSNTEDTSNTIDFLSNGFKQRGSGHSNYNASGANYIFMAFAENPFVTSTGVPATAR